jgi:hypothetical protein
MINWFLSIMVHKKLLTLAEAEYFAKELVFKTHPQNFTEAHKIVEKLLNDFEK